MTRNVSFLKSENLFPKKFAILASILFSNFTQKTSMENTLQYLSRQTIAIIQVHEEKKTVSILNTMKNKIIHGKSPGDLMKNVNFRNPKE